MSSLLPDNLMPETNLSRDAALLAAPHDAAVPHNPKEDGHPCSGAGRCCGRCRNPKQPLAIAAMSQPDSGNPPTSGESLQPLKPLSSSQHLPSSDSATD